MTVTGIGRVDGAPTAGWRLEPAGSALVIRNVAEPARSFHELAGSLPAEPDRAVLVVANGAAPALVATDPGITWELLRWLGHGAPRRPGNGIRLVMSVPPGTSPGFLPSVARALADLLDLDVVAPTGPLIVPRPGHLFVTGSGWGWLTVHPTSTGVPPSWEGPRFPAPDWQRSLPPEYSPSSPAVRATAVPAGLWLHPAGTPAPSTALPFLADVEPDRMTVFVTGTSDRDGLATGLLDLCRLLLSATPPAGRPPTVVVTAVMISGAPQGAGSWPQWLADRLGRWITARHGLLVRGSDGVHQVSLPDAAGRVAWQPFVSEAAYGPGAAEPVASAWRAPAPGLVEREPATYALGGAWSVEAVSAGLWFRPAVLPRGAGRLPARHLPPSPDAVAVFIGVSGGEEPSEAVLESIGGLLRQLPAPVAARVRLFVPPALSTSVGARLAGLRFGTVRTLDETGVIGSVPAGAAVGVARPPAPTAPVPVPRSVVPGPVARTGPPAPAVPDRPPVPDLWQQRSGAVALTAVVDRAGTLRPIAATGPLPGANGDRAIGATVAVPPTYLGQRTVPPTSPAPLPPTSPVPPPQISAPLMPAPTATLPPAPLMPAPTTMLPPAPPAAPMPVVPAPAASPGAPSPGPSAPAAAVAAPPPAAAAPGPQLAPGPAAPGPAAPGPAAPGPAALPAPNPLAPAVPPEAPAAAAVSPAVGWSGLAGALAHSSVQNVPMSGFGTSSTVEPPTMGSPASVSTPKALPAPAPDLPAPTEAAPGAESPDATAPRPDAAPGWAPDVRLAMAPVQLAPRSSEPDESDPEPVFTLEDLPDEIREAIESQLLGSMLSSEDEPEFRIPPPSALVPALTMARHQLVPKDEDDGTPDESGPEPLEPVRMASFTPAVEGGGTLLTTSAGVPVVPAIPSTPMVPAAHRVPEAFVAADSSSGFVAVGAAFPATEAGGFVESAPAGPPATVEPTRVSPAAPTAEAPEAPAEPGNTATPAANVAGAAPVADVAGPPHVVPAERRSTLEERQILRVSLGWRYDTEAREVVVLLAERPGIRTAAAGEADAMVTDLVALRAFLAGDHRTLVADQRAGRIGTDGPLLACVTGGLRRVPSYRGVTFASVPGAAAMAREHYHQGRVFWEPAPLVTGARQTIAGPDDVEFVFWSATGRRCEDFAPDPDTRPILFSPSTRFGVLATETVATGGFRVYLTEVRTRDLGRWDGETVAADARILDRLRETAAKTPLDVAPAVVPLVGVGPDGRPFVPPPA